MIEHSTTYSSVTRLTLNTILIQGLLALRPILADSLPLSPAHEIILQVVPHSTFFAGVIFQDGTGFVHFKVREFSLILRPCPCYRARPLGS